jgi:hypothetical protein
MLGQLKQKHHELGERYRDALRSYKAQDPQTIFLVDSMVRGIDRAPTDAMDDLLRVIQDRANQLTIKIGETTQANYNSLSKVIVGGMSAGIVLLFLMLWLSFARLKS